MSNERMYARAVKVLQPSVAEMKRRHAPAIARDKLAAGIVDDLLAQTGLTAKELYDGNRFVSFLYDTDDEMQKAIRVCLLGKVRRG